MSGTIPILSPGQERDTGRAVLPTRVSGQLMEIALLDASDLKEALLSVTAQLQDLLDGLPQAESGAFGVEEAEISLGITKEGKIGILSSLQIGGGIQAAVKLRLKRR